MGANDVLVFASTPGAIADTDGGANSVAEHAAIGAVVGIDANAATDGVGGIVTYSLADNAGGRFAINAGTGVVTVANADLLDFDTAASHQIVVRATNNLGAFSEQAFTIAVTEIPDEADRRHQWQGRARRRRRQTTRSPAARAMTRSRAATATTRSSAERARTSSTAGPESTPSPTPDRSRA